VGKNPTPGHTSIGLKPGLFQISKSNDDYSFEELEPVLELDELPIELSLLFMSDELDGLEVVPPISFFFMAFTQFEKPFSPL
jgi:hypothetical protein